MNTFTTTREDDNARITHETEDPKHLENRGGDYT